jgi:anti-sigma regulatory factor (Ser/Thr protein kinase)
MPDAHGVALTRRLAGTTMGSRRPSPGLIARMAYRPPDRHRTPQRTQRQGPIAVTQPSMVRSRPRHQSQECWSAAERGLHSRRCGDDATETAALLVTELVTNAVLHANGPSLWLSVEETTTDVLHVTVRDGSRQGIPRNCAQQPDQHRTGGRGLFMVDALSTRWGWEPLDIGKSVWFELPCQTASHS